MDEWPTYHIYTRFQKGFHIERYIDRYILLFSCTCARVHFSVAIVQRVKKSRFNDKFFLRRVLKLCSNLKRTCRLSFFTKKHVPCNTNLQWRIIWLILGMRKTAREAAELCGVIKLIGQMSWHLKQVTKHFCWRGVWKNVLSRGVIRETVKLTWKHLWPRVYSVFSGTLPYRPWFYTKKGEALIYRPAHHGYDNIYFYEPSQRLGPF